jgi:hypothetical protein
MNSFSEVTNRGLGDNLLGSIKGVFFGLVLLVLAFPVLWWNEGRTDMSTVAKTAVVVKPDGSSSPAAGKLVAVTDKLQTAAQLGDAGYLKAGPYVSLHRTSEMFAWVEKVTTKTEKKLGGGTRETKTYDYDKKWTHDPESGADFKVSLGHTNPTLEITSQHWSAPSASIGAYTVDPSEVELPSSRDLELTPERVENPKRVIGSYLYLGKADAKAPKLGDVRLSYEAVEANRLVTAYGQLSGKELQPYMYKGEDKLFRIVDGTHEQAIASLHAEHTMISWALRLLGFFFMWIGLSMLLGPVNAVLDIVPFVGSAGRFMTGLALFPIALALTIITSVCSMVAHSPIVLGLVIAVALVGLILRYQHAKAAKVAR